MDGLFYGVIVLSEIKILKLEVDDVRKPFQRIDVRAYDELHIEGYKFPIESSRQAEIKEFRPMKPASLIHSECKEKDMISRLEDNGVTFTYDEKEKAKEILLSINYYRLSAFYRYQTDDNSFSELFRLYSFDRYIREAVSDLIPQVEISIKTSLAYHLSHLYKNNSNKKDFMWHSEAGDYTESLCYLDKNLYKSKKYENSSVDMMLSEFSSILMRKQDKDPSIKHHIINYGGNIPIWTLVEHLTMGNIATFVTNLSRKYRKEWIRKYMPMLKKDALIVEWVRTIQTLRNQAAHYGRFYGYSFPYNPTILLEDQAKISEVGTSDVGDKEKQKQRDRSRHTLFTGFIIMKYFYKTMPEYEIEHWNNIIESLDRKIHEFKIDLYHIGFVNNWKNLLIIDL